MSNDQSIQNLTSTLKTCQGAFINIIFFFISSESIYITYLLNESIKMQREEPTKKL